MKKFDWLKNFLENKIEKNWESVSEVIPNEFDEYFLLHWNVGIVDNFPFDEYPDKNETIEETNKRIKIERVHNLFLNSEENKLFRNTSLKELSELFEIDYTYQILDKIKQTPAIKILEELSTNNLRLTISNLSENKNLNFFVDDFYRYPNHEISKKEMENISVKQYMDLQKDLCFDYWSYLFPNDRSWCITTAEDLPMFLCAKSELAESLKENVEMELFKVDYDEKLY